MRLFIVKSLLWKQNGCLVENLLADSIKYELVRFIQYLVSFTTIDSRNNKPFISY